MKVLHIGYLVENIEKSIEEFKAFGYESISENIINKAMMCLCHFMELNSSVIELISPINETSSVYDLLQKLGCGPYHVCYESKSLLDDIKRLRKNGFVVIRNTKTESEKCVFLYSPNIGMVELNEV